MSEQQPPRQSLADKANSEHVDPIPVPLQDIPKRRIPSTPWSTTFECDIIDVKNDVFTEQDLCLLAHLNCSYFSSGAPPTLLSLKQHAQSLAILIKKISVSTGKVFIGDGAPAVENEAFDWLADLSKPYENGDDYHSLPLRVLRNQISSENEVLGLTHYCPLTIRKNMARLGDPLGIPPYESVHNLLMHANECLELLDSDFGETGGLLSVLPTNSEDDSDQLECARNSLLGQWLVYHQHLVSRQRELECDLANLTDVLVKEASIPRQLLHDGQSTQPQDRYILTNVGDDVTGLIHNLLDQREVELEERLGLWEAHGVLTNDRVRDRGIVQVDVISRMSRLKGYGRASPIFVLPCSERHPGVKITRALEKKTPEIRLIARKPGESARRRAWEAELAADNERELKALREEHRILQRSYEEQRRYVMELESRLDICREANV